MCVHISCLIVSESLQSCGLWTASLLCPWNSPGKNNGVGCHSLFQGIFPTEGSNPGLPALQADSLPSESTGKCRVCIDLTIYLKLTNVLTELNELGCIKGDRGDEGGI